MGRPGLRHLGTCLVTIAASAALCPAALGAEPVTSTFDTGDDGWRVIGDTTSAIPEWRRTGGNPGGFVRAHDVVIGGVMYWKAPAKFRGDRTTSYGLRLEFDLRQSANFRPFATHDVRLVSPGLTLDFDHAPDPGLTAFTHYEIPLHETAGWYKAGTPRTPPTREELLQVLGDLTDLQVRAEFETGPDSDDLDNAVLEVESDPPETEITAGPPPLSSSSSASFTLAADEPATFACRLDDAPSAACTSPHELHALADGEHVLEVRATDRAGNVDPTPATWTWTVDTRPPQTAITAPPEGQTQRSRVTFAFEADEAGTAFACRVDDAPFAACPSPHEVDGLADGDHAFEVRGTDRAGNAGPVARRQFTVCDFLRLGDHVPGLPADVCLPGPR